MQQVIYIDVLIVLNILLTYLLLLATSHMLRNEPPTGRMLAGSFLGGAYSLIILAPPFGLFLSTVIKLLLSLSIVTVTFKPRSLRGLG
ncbi:MAG: sigma-E processing peptidase SpoIIGA, partial [Oscillospiraceae bacterium]|nr:sigma-E processing peptidase SpoIIGA [Oscillospiraceae bacterium]